LRVATVAQPRLINQFYHQVMKAGGSRWHTSSLIHNLRLLD
jgi:hypothetical protein